MLAICYHNMAIELEHLKEYEKARACHAEAVKVLMAQLHCTDRNKSHWPTPVDLLGLSGGDISAQPWQCRVYVVCAHAVEYSLKRASAWPLAMPNGVRARALSRRSAAQIRASLTLIRCGSLSGCLVVLRCSARLMISAHSGEWLHLRRRRPGSTGPAERLRRDMQRKPQETTRSVCRLFEEPFVVCHAGVREGSGKGTSDVHQVQEMPGACRKQAERAA